MSRVAPDLGTAIDMAKRGQESMVKCPGHDDGTASLHVSPGQDQPVTLRCMALCENEAILAAAGIEWSEVCRPLEQSMSTDQVRTSQGTASHVYQYHDEEGRVLYQSLRVPLAGGRKTFMQRHPVGDQWVWNMQGVRRVLYRLPSILRAKEQGRTIWLFEGEKDVETAVLDGLDATCNPMGAGKWHESFSETLSGCDICIVADNDSPGQAHARSVRESLEAKDCRVTVLETKMEGCKDYSDHRSRGGTWETLTVTYQTEHVGASRPEYDIREMINTDFATGREIIPGHFAAANICLLVGPEGFGKSLFMRQLAVQCAAGINPFTSADMEPLKVLFIDGENPESQQKMDWVTLDYLARRHRDGANVIDGNLKIIAAWEDPPDLVSPGGLEWFCERITSVQPDICFLGPVSDLVDADVADSGVVRKFKKTLYKARAICGTGFVVEHHSPHRMQGDKTREMRPYGSSVFRRFPDFGYGLQPTDEPGRFELSPFRGARVRARAWPEDLRWGTPGSMEWPWEFSPAIGGSVTVGNFGA